MKAIIKTSLIAAALLVSSAAGAADIIVSAAASLANAFGDIGKEFEKAHPGTRVLLNLGASGQLLQQLSRGAPADVFASADQETMDRAQKQRLVAPSSRVDFVSNQLVLATAAEGSSPVTSLADLDKADVQRIGVGTPESVPAGRYAKEALELSGQWDKLKAKYVYGQNVRQVLDYVSRGEVDAGFVYATDAATLKDRVKVVATVPTKQPIVYPIAAVKGSGNENSALEFIAYVRSDAGQKILAKYGFLPTGKP
jgi:molybdate transport system substrate-binding protein